MHTEHTPAPPRPLPTGPAAATHALRLDRPQPMRLSGTVFPSTMHALVGVSDQDLTYRARIAGCDLQQLAGQQRHDAEWQRGETMCTARSACTIKLAASAAWTG